MVSNTIGTVYVKMLATVPYTGRWPNRLGQDTSSVSPPGGVLLTGRSRFVLFFLKEKKTILQTFKIAQALNLNKYKQTDNI